MKTRRDHGFTMVEIIAVLAIIALLATVIFSREQREKARAHQIQCANQIKSIPIGFRVWSGDNADRFPMQVSITNGGAMEWIENGNVAGVFFVMSNEVSIPKILWCPADRRRRIASSFANGLSNSNVSYFIGVDASETQPQMLLLGDDNFLVNGQPVKPGVLALATNAPVAWSTARHNQQGNVAFADGSVHTFSSSKLRESLSWGGTNVIRLAFP